MVNWNELYKIRINNYSEAFAKHEVVKLLIVSALLNKYHSKKKYQEIYTEYPVCEGKVCDVYHLNNLTKEEYFYEVQSNISKVWLEQLKQTYGKMEKDYIIVDLNKLSDNLPELNKQIKELII
jgi:hypothetical protein